MSRLAATEQCRRRVCVDCDAPADWVVTRATPRPKGLGGDDVTYRQPYCHAHAWAMVADPTAVPDAVTLEPIGLALPGTRRVLTNGRAWVGATG